MRQAQVTLHYQIDSWSRPYLKEYRPFIFLKWHFFDQFLHFRRLKSRPGLEVAAEQPALLSGERRNLKSGCAFRIPLPRLYVQQKDLVNSSLPHAELIATFRRAEADAAHKFKLIKAAAGKGPGAMQTATATADRAAKRRDTFAKKLAALNVDPKP